MYRWRLKIHSAELVIKQLRELEDLTEIEQMSVKNKNKYLHIRIL